MCLICRNQPNFRLTIVLFIFLLLKVLIYLSNSLLSIFFLCTHFASLILACFLYPDDLILFLECAGRKIFVRDFLPAQRDYMRTVAQTDLYYTLLERIFILHELLRLGKQKTEERS